MQRLGPAVPPTWHHRAGGAWPELAGRTLAQRVDAWRLSNSMLIFGWEAEGKPSLGRWLLAGRELMPGAGIPGRTA